HAAVDLERPAALLQRRDGHIRSVVRHDAGGGPVRAGEDRAHDATVEQLSRPRSALRSPALRAGFQELPRDGRHHRFEFLHAHRAEQTGFACEEGESAALIQTEPANETAHSGGVAEEPAEGELAGNSLPARARAVLLELGT